MSPRCSPWQLAEAWYVGPAVVAEILTMGFVEGAMHVLCRDVADACTRMSHSGGPFENRESCVLPQKDPCPKARQFARYIGPKAMWAAA